MKALFCLAAALLCAVPAAASVTVTSPVNGSTVTSPFRLTATASPCSSQAIASMGYSLDLGSTTIMKGASISTTVAAPVGSHVLHVKSWGPSGAACGTTVSITVKRATTNVTVTAPVAGSTVASPFSLIAAGTLCSGQSITKMGYALDSGTTRSVAGASLSVSVTAAAGGHTVHVKSWGSGGAACDTDVAITVPNITNVTVTAPLGGSTVTSPFSLSAAGTLCSGQAITAMGYALDNSSTTTQNGTSLNASVTATTGSHTLHVMSWGSGMSCSNDVAINVTAASSGPAIPSNALATNLIQNLGTWTAEHDAGTTGTSTGTMTLVATPSISGSAREFDTSYTDYGGERYNVAVTPDAVSTNFVYDTQVYIASPANDLANVEMDLNQVLSNGDTIIYGFQCDGWSKTWDYTQNVGTVASPKANWLHSNQSCDPQMWATNSWHHVQIQYSRDDSGNVTYQSVWLDGTEQDLNVTVPSEFSLGWQPSLNTNLQIDGYNSTSGSSTTYLDSLTLYSW